LGGFKFREHSSQPKLVTTSLEMENAILKNNGGITVLIIAEKENIHAIKDTVRKVQYIQIHIPHYTMIHYCTFLACDGPESDFCFGIRNLNRGIQG
jgi:hypothetical protein